MEINEITAEIVDAAMKVHVSIGPGLLESVYQTLLARELRRRGLSVEREKHVLFEYDGITFTEGLRMDLLVNGVVIVEVKSVERFAPVHSKQLLSYLRLTRLSVGLLINFGAATLKEGLKRVVNRYAPPDSAGRLPVRAHSTQAAGS